MHCRCNLNLVADDSLARNGIQLEIGKTKNVNKNPEGEWAIQEQELELKKAHPDDGPISSVQLAFAVARLNNRIRNRGLSSKEIVMQRDGMTGERLNLNDDSLSEELFDHRVKNHEPSARAYMCNFWHFGQWPKFHARIWQFWKSAHISETTSRRAKISSSLTPWGGRKGVYVQFLAL